MKQDMKEDTLAGAADLPAVPALFGRFVMHSKLGAGGMGEVWLATDPKLGRKVALKLLKGAESDEVARFSREAETAGRLNHANIAAVYETGLAAGRHYIAMQYVEGSTLKSFPRTNRRLLVRLMLAASKTVAFAHERGVIHRDLKPENVMVEVRGRQHRVYVMDFGLARSMRGSIELTRSGAVMGTPAFMSPEQSLGERVDARADVWSLGATLYELLSDAKPFVGRTVYDTLRLVQEEEPRPIRVVNPRIDRDLAMIVEKCLQKDKAHRYPSAAALADDLDRWLKNEPVKAHPPTLSYRASKWVRRRLALVVSSAVVATVLAGSLAWWASAKHEQTTRLAEIDRTQERQDQDAAAIERNQRRVDAATLHSAGVLLVSQGNYKAAVEKLDKSVELDPSLLKAWADRAACKLKLNDLEGADADLARAASLGPLPIAARQTQGAVAFLRGDYLKADEVLTGIIDGKEPFSTLFETYRLRGLARANLKQNDLALADWRKALEVAPADWKLRDRVEAYIRQTAGHQ